MIENWSVCSLNSDRLSFLSQGLLPFGGGYLLTFGLRKTCGCCINIFGYYTLDAILSQFTYVAWLCGTFAWTENSSNLTIFDIVIGLPYLSEWGSVPPKGLHGVPALFLRLSQLSPHVFLVYNNGNKYTWNKMTKKCWKWKTMFNFLFGLVWVNDTSRMQGWIQGRGLFYSPPPIQGPNFLNFIEFI